KPTMPKRIIPNLYHPKSGEVVCATRRCRRQLPRVHSSAQFVWGHAFKACRYMRKNGTAFAGRANRLGSSEARSAGFKCTDRTQRIRATKPPAPTIRVSRPQGVQILICRKDIKRIQQ